MTTYVSIYIYIKLFSIANTCTVFHLFQKGLALIASAHAKRDIFKEPAIPVDSVSITSNTTDAQIIFGRDFE